MSVAVAPRWAVSFADLGLLLLGCFVMLHALSRSEGVAAAAATAAPLASYRAANLFEPGEARLTAAGANRLTEDARRFNGQLLLASRGTDAGGARLDRIELAAARTASVARALRESGIAEDRLSVRIEGDGEAGQMLLIRSRDVTAGTIR